jgi:hypothetical protein
MTRIQVCRSTRRNAWGSAAIGSALLAASTQFAVADCFDNYAAVHGVSVSLKAALEDPELMKCRGNPNPADRKKKLDRAAALSPPAASKAKVAVNDRPVPPPTPAAFVPNVYPLLRNSFTDVWLFDKHDKNKGVSEVSDAEGAQLSFADDRVALNRAWTANAMGAVVFQYLHDRYPKDGSFNFIGLSVAPYVQIERLTNSNPKAAVNNIDQITFGGSAEVGFDWGPGANYFRIRGAGVEDRVAGSSSGSAIAEWIPVVDGILNSPVEFAGVPVSFQFNPELKARYDEIVVNDITGAKQYLFRTGAQASLKYRAIADAIPDSLKGIGFLSSLHGETTVSWLTSSFDGRSYGYFKSSLTYNIDPEGYVGLSGSYTKGRSEDTGRRQDIWTLGLTAKL